MGHQNHDPNNDLKVVETISKEKEPEKNPHPFFEKNDITFLSIINPLLSPNAQKMITFLVNFGNNEPASGLNIGDFLNQMNAKPKNSGTDLLPSLLNLASSPEIKNALNPALITTLLGMLGNNKKEE